MDEIGLEWHQLLCSGGHRHTPEEMGTIDDVSTLATHISWLNSRQREFIYLISIQWMGVGFLTKEQIDEIEQIRAISDL